MWFIAAHLYTHKRLYRRRHRSGRARCHSGRLFRKVRKTRKGREVQIQNKTHRGGTFKVKQEGHTHTQWTQVLTQNLMSQKKQDTNTEIWNSKTIKQDLIYISGNCNVQGTVKWRPPYETEQIRAVHMSLAEHHSLCTLLMFILCAHVCVCVCVCSDLKFLSYLKRCENNFFSWPWGWIASTTGGVVCCLNPWNLLQWVHSYL